MKIVNLNIENIKKIKVVDITPGKDGVVILEGKNAQGKSSIMDSISMVLGGEKLIPVDPVRQGEERAAIKVDLGEVMVKRTFKPDGNSTLEIKTKAGEKVRSPQEWLNEKLKLATMDPSVFIRLRPVERVEELKKIPGLDCTAEDQAYMVEYDKRTLVNRDLETAKKALTEYEGLVAPKDLRTVSQIQKEIDVMEEKNKAIREQNRVIDDKQAQFESLKKDYNQLSEKKTYVRRSWDDALQSIKAAEEVIRQQQSLIATAQKDIDVCKTGIDEIEKSMDAVEENADVVKKDIEASMRVSEYSTAKLKEELVAASETAAIGEKLARKLKLETDIKKYEDDAAAIESVMRGIKEKKRAKLAAFKLPVKGLEVGERDIMFSGIPFDNLSQAQKISVSMALAIAQQPTLRIIKVAEGSLFDENTLKQVIDFAAANDFQVWIERVANTPSGNAIFIEDGEIVK